MAVLFNFFEFLNAQGVAMSPERVAIADVGAMKLGDAKPPYWRIVEAGRAEVTGFEPQAEECARLVASASPHQRYFPCALGEGGPATLHVNAAKMTSSLYPSNTPLLELFQNLSQLMRTVETVQLETKRLDDVAELGRVDLLKLDVQGAELSVLRGAERVLKDVLVVQAEVEFVPLYAGQPLFADVDAYLRSQGFMLHTMDALQGRMFKPFWWGSDLNRGVRQVLWTDAVYIRDVTEWGTMPAEKMLAMAAILHEVYASVDLAGVALDRAAGAGVKPLREAYFRRLGLVSAGGEPRLP